MSDQQPVRQESGYRCERCGQNTLGSDHTAESDCIRALRDLLAQREKDLTECRELYAGFRALMKDPVYWHAGAQWVLSDNGTALLERLGWTPPADWWTYGPTDWVPWRDRSEDEDADSDELPKLVARIQQARQTTPADVYLLLVEIEHLRERLAAAKTELGERTQEVDRLLRIAHEAWECFCTDDPEQRVNAARHLVIALTVWRQHG